MDLTDQERLTNLLLALGEVLPEEEIAYIAEQAGDQTAAVNFQAGMGAAYGALMEFNIDPDEFFIKHDID